MKPNLIALCIYILLFSSCSDEDNVLVSSNESRLEIALGAGGYYQDALIRMNIDNGAVDTLFIGEQIYSYPLWSPNGESIMFNLRNNIYIYSLVDHDFKILAKNGSIWGNPSWGPNSRQFTFGIEISNKYYLAIEKLDGSPRYLYNPGGRFQCIQPQWSPDGKYIMFETFDREIFLYDTSDSTIVQMSLPSGEKHDPRWAPDGMRIAYSNTNTSNSGIYVVNLDGSNSKYLSSEPSYSRYPVWSPDGQKVSYSRSKYDGGHQYCYYNLLIEEEILVDDQLEDYVFIGSWSYDSKYLSYEKEIGNKTKIVIYDIVSESAEELVIGNLSFFTGAFRP